ncbi:KAP family P-loop NTPase fold protein [Kangiella sp.]|uniref:KAP family P-loop NTPase fold protein n=1 Tax=Kangiella sp. TaxID=1920245 RepID=UPI003A954A6C
MNWEDDKLDRKAEAEYLVKYINRKYEASDATSLSINLNAEWGQGKTFFLRNLRRDLSEQGYPTVYYDAWRNDFSNEALVSFISEISDELAKALDANPKIKEKIHTFKEKGKQIIKSSVPILLSALVKHLLRTDDLSGLIPEDEDKPDSNQSDSTSDFSDTVSKLTTSAATSMLEQHKESQKSIGEFTEALKELVKELGKGDGKLKDKKLPIYILVDELDRCRPTFAIELLEAIKHLFGVHGVVFLVATNTSELQASVKAVYGGEFSAKAYLRRFFDIEYSFRKPSRKEFCRQVISDIEFGDNVNSYEPNGQDDFESILDMFWRFCDYFNLGLRDIEQLSISLEACIYTAEDKVELPLLLFLLILKQQEFGDYYERFKQQGGKLVLENFFKENSFNNTIFLQTKERYHKAHTYHNSKIAIKDVLSVYFHNLGRANGDNFFFSSSSFSIQERIVENLRSELMRSNSKDRNKRLIFYKYFEMVQHAGQFSEID